MEGCFTLTRPRFCLLDVPQRTHRTCLCNVLFLAVPLSRRIHIQTMRCFPLTLPLSCLLDIPLFRLLSHILAITLFRLSRLVGILFPAVLLSHLQCIHTRALHFLLQYT